MGPASTQYGHFPSASLGLLGSKDEVTAQKSALQTLSSSPLRGGRHRLLRKWISAGIRGPGSPPPAGPQQLLAARVSKTFLLDGSPWLTLSRGQEPAPWSVLRATGQRSRSMAVPRGSLHRHWTPGARGPGSEGRGGQGCCTNRLLERALQKAPGRGPATAAGLQRPSAATP